MWNYSITCKCDNYIENYIALLYNAFPKDTGPNTGGSGSSASCIKVGHAGSLSCSSGTLFPSSCPELKHRWCLNPVSCEANKNHRVKNISGASQLITRRLAPQAAHTYATLVGPPPQLIKQQQPRDPSDNFMVAKTKDNINVAPPNPITLVRGLSTCSNPNPRIDSD